MSLPAEILEVATGLVEACDEGSLASRALMGRTDVSPELMGLLTELRGFMISIRAEGHRMKALVGAAGMTGQVERPLGPPVVQQEIVLELPAMPDAGHRVPTKPPLRRDLSLCGKDLAAGERAERL